MSDTPQDGSAFAALTRALQSSSVRSADSGGIWQELAERLDPAEFRPELAPDVEVKTFRLRWGNDYAMVANPRELVHYQLQPSEAELLPLMDGTRTVKEIVVERFRDSGDLEIEDVVELVETLRQGNFLTERFVDVREIVRRAGDPSSLARRKARAFVRTLSIDWAGAHGLVEWFYRHLLRFFFRPVVAVPIGFIAVLGVAAFASVYRSGTFELGGGSPAVLALVLLTMDYVLTFVHELGHAVVLVHYGRKVKSAGFMLYFGSPAFFVESSDVLMLDRGQRIVQSSAGPYAEMVLSGLASLFIWAFPDAAISPLLYTWVVINYFVVFMNLIPLLELDGYFILSDLIQVPDLRPRSLRFIRYDLWQKLRGRERITKQEIGLASYAIVGIAFTVFSVYTAFFFWETVFGGLISDLWRGGPIGRLLLAALAIFLAGPVIRGLIALTRSLLRKVKRLTDAVRFRLQTRWRVEAARLIDGSPLFEDLPEDVLSDLAGRVALRSFPAGRPVFRQGDRPDALFIVRSGTVQIVEEDPATGKETVLRTLVRGDTFGELGLVDGAPRSATARAGEDAELFEVDESTFDRLLAVMVNVPEFMPTLQQAAELRGLRPFATLGSDDISMLQEHGSWEQVAPGVTIVREGEEGDAFYVIGSGRAQVVRAGEVLRELGPGDHFGEIALLEDVPRTATVVALTPCRVYRLDREAFDAVLAAAFRQERLPPAWTVERTSQH